MRACNLLLLLIEKPLFVTGLGVDFSKGETSSQLNGLFTRSGVHVMLKGIIYQCIEMVFSFICRYVKLDPGYIEDPELTKVNKMNFELRL